MVRGLAAEELIATDLDGNSEVVFQVPSFPVALDWLPNGQLLIISARDQTVLTPGPSEIDTSARTGVLLSSPAPATHAGWP